jgi:serine O-acetyltransferase
MNAKFAKNKKMVAGVKEGSRGLTSLVDVLCSNGNGIACAMRRTPHDQPLPSRDVVIELSEALRSVLFPGYFGFPDLRVESVPYHVGSTLDRIQHTLEEQIKRGLCFSCLGDKECLPACDRRSRTITRKFLSRLPDVQRLLITDVRAAFEGDPAASSPDEVIFCYPGLQAITSYRLAHELHQLGVPLIPRMITEHAHSITGIDIHPGADIGEKFFIDHGTGVVIGETCVIGSGVRIYQGVTLGALSLPLAAGDQFRGKKRHPTIEDEVIVYSGATILGGDTVIGARAVIGGNVWLTESVPPDTRVVMEAPRLIYKTNGTSVRSTEGDLA